MKKPLKLTLKIVVVLIIALFVSLLLLLWRLSSSPIQLNQFVPRIEQATSNLPGGLSVRLKGLGLFWNRSEREVDLRALDVELVESAGSSLVTAPEVNVSLSVFALLRGVVALSSIELQDVDVQLVRREDGSYQVFRKMGDTPVQGNDTRQRDYSETIRHLLKVLESDADTEKPLSYLKKVKIKGSLDIDDRKNDLHWAASAVESLFVGHRGEVNGKLSVTFSSPQALDGVHTDIDLKLKDDAVTASLAFGGVSPAGFARLDKRLAALAGLDTALSGTINTVLTLPDKLQSLGVNIKGAPGQLSYQDFYTEPLRLNSLDLQLSANLPGKSLQVSSLDVSLGDTANPLSLHLTGAAEYLDDSVAIRFESGLQHLKVKELDLYWPVGIAEGARNWLVTNLAAGMVSRANLAMAMRVPTRSDAKFRLGQLKGTLAYSDVTVAYFGLLPPATGVTGSGTFDKTGFDLDINTGLVNGVNIESGKVIISGLDNRQPAISVKTHLNGPLGKVFAVLEAPPIKLNSDSTIGVVSEKLGGQIEAEFDIALPLRSSLADGELQYQASGKITDGTFERIYQGYDLTSADIEFSVDPSKVKFNGPLEFSGIPLVIDWTTSLAGPSRGHADFTINSPGITSAQVSALGFDVGDYMQGGITLTTTAKLAPGGHVTASIESDLNNAALAVPQIHWHKAIGDGGKISFTLKAEKDHLHAGDINVVLGELKTSGNAEFDLASPVMSLSLEHLSLTYAQLKNLKLELHEGKNLKLTVQGGEANLDPLFSREGERVDAQEKQAAVDSKALAGQLKSSGFNLEIGASKLDKVYINSDTFFDNVRFGGRWDSAGWQEISLSGHDPAADAPLDNDAQPPGTERLAIGQFRLEYGPRSTDGYPLLIETEDLGSLVSAVMGRNVMKGGYLKLNGDSQGPFLKMPIQASFDMNGFTVKEAPVISRVLNMASLTQIISTFRQTGLAFNAASGDIHLDGSRLSSQKIRMRGGSLGLSVGGWADLREQRVELSGAIVPMVKLHAVVGAIPLLGQVLVGADGKGIMAVDYTVTGPISQPETTIRKAPLTRGLLKDTTGEDVAPTEPETQ